MGRPVCTQGDMITGVCNHGSDCCPHYVVGYYMNGANTVRAGGRNVQRISDPVVTSCPHCGYGQAGMGSGTVIAENIGVTRIGELVVLGGGAGHNSTANPSVLAGG